MGGCCVLVQCKNNNIPTNPSKVSKASKNAFPVKKFTLIEVYDLHFDKYVDSPELRKLKLEDKHLKAVRWSRVCRTDKIGKAVLGCPTCGEVSYIAQSCKHRFCAQCGVADTHKWAEKMLTKLMNCKHHHITMTLPKAYRKLSKMNKDKLHNILFKAANFVVNQWFIDQHKLRTGIVSVLHTAGADLKYHPHIHMIVARGGMELRTQEYRFIKGKYLCDNEIFGKLLKEKFNQLLINEYKKGNIQVYKKINSTEDLINWTQQLKDKHWIVNIEKPLEDVNQIIGYVGRYTKRACISEYKIEYLGEDAIKFRFNDYKNTPRGEKPKQSIITMKPFEFLDQLLQHVPNKRYRMVRYSGIYNSYYLNKIPQNLKIEKVIKEDIVWDDTYDWGDFEQFRKAVIRAGKPDPFICQHCNALKIFIGVQFPKKGKKNKQPNLITINDSS